MRYLADSDCRIFATERRRLRAAGAIIGDCDLLIGATALRYDLTLLTNNRRHFDKALLFSLSLEGEGRGEGEPPGQIYLPGERRPSPPTPLPTGEGSLCRE